ncbi:MAG TPA: serine/threonine-protein kinase [Pyrinomonadaceae bacterium]|nr:serine/threonine-protein kinase [Pyrinomonadaceae bacterium]
MSPPLNAGTRLGRYEIHSLLGTGGMGEVYLATDTQLDRPVAIKILPADATANQHRLHRFMQEARAASKISGTHVAHIYEIGEAEGLQFIAMEYVEGDQLAQRITERKLAAAEVARIGAQIAEALEEAHARGITHRDIKPQNVIIVPRGTVKVLDFGLAKLTGASGWRPAAQANGFQDRLHLPPRMVRDGKTLTLARGRPKLTWCC